MRRTALLICALALGACRDGAEPFTMPQLNDSSTAGRLTYNVNGDHAPVWSLNADSLYYGAVSFPNFPSTNGLLMALPRRYGSATALLPSVQIGVVKTPWLAGPALSPDGNNVAFFEITKYGDTDFSIVSCPFSPNGPAYDTAFTSSNLQEAVLRVRARNTTGGDNAQLTVTFPGRVYDYTQNPYVINNTATPFHRLFDGDKVPVLRPSWSPDGTKLVFSDGATLRVWSVGSATSTAIPNTNGGMLPAWSPDGNWIAYSEPILGPTQSINCYGLLPGAHVNSAVFHRTIYTSVDRENIMLKLIKPDGTGKKSLGNGDAPAWLPDSRTVVAHRSGNLFSISIDAGAATQIANTDKAFEPAVSRDGRFLAFARRKDATDLDSFVLGHGQYNLWYVSF